MPRVHHPLRPISHARARAGADALRAAERAEAIERIVTDELEREHRRLLRETGNPRGPDFRCGDCDAHRSAHGPCQRCNSTRPPTTSFMHPRAASVAGGDYPPPRRIPVTTTTPTDQQLAASRRHQDANPRSLVGRHFTAGGLLVNEYTHGLLVAFDAAGRQIVDVGISW